MYIFSLLGALAPIFHCDAKMIGVERIKNKLKKLGMM